MTSVLGMASNLECLLPFVEQAGKNIMNISFFFFMFVFCLFVYIKLGLCGRVYYFVCVLVCVSVYLCS